jgi:hypothetical protein
VHGGDEGLDVLAADGPDRFAADRRVDVGAQHRPVGGNAGVRAKVLNAAEFLDCLQDAVRDRLAFYQLTAEGGQHAYEAWEGS